MIPELGTSHRLGKLEAFSGCLSNVGWEEASTNHIRFKEATMKLTQRIFLLSAAVSTRLLRLSALSLVLLLFQPCWTAAQDAAWPHWMGPTRNNVWSTGGIIEKFPEGGPKVLWKTKIGIGYAGPAVAQGKVIAMDFESQSNVKIANFERREFDGVERICCFDEATGKQLWDHKYKVRYTVSYPSGPRCTPIIEGDRVYTLGAEGNLICFKLSDGSVVWSKALRDEYGAKSALWGYSAHPLIDGEHLITLAGGKGSHMVALNKNTGEEVWKSLSSTEQGYSPPTLVEVAGKRQLIAFAPDQVSSLDPTTGKQIWTVPYESTSNSVIMSPLLIDGKYLYVAGYSNKSLLLEFSEDGTSVKTVWSTRGPQVISPVNVQPFLDSKNNILYGMDQGGDLRAVQLPAGERLWNTSEPVSKRRVGSGTAFLVRVGESDRFVLFNENGELILADLTREGYQEVDRAKVIEASNNAFGRKVVWSMPAFANGHVYLRNDEELICLDLSK